MDRSLISLRTALFGFVLLGAAAVGLAAMISLQNRLGAFQGTALESAVSVRAQGAALDLARSLERDWSALRAAVQTLDPSDSDAIGLAADVLAGDRRRVSWAGFAGLDGRIEAASGDMLIGADITERLWFRRGLEGAFAGDAPDALLLNRLLGDTDEEPIRFLDLSTPVLNARGEVAGVMALHLNFGWVSDFLAETAGVLGIGLFLISHDGSVLYASEGAMPERLDLPSMRAARAGAQISGFEEWPDGRRYLTTVIPSIGYGDLPSFGWRLVARIEPGALGDTGEALTRWVVLLFAAGLAVLLSMTMVFYRLFLQPIHQLAANAARMAEDEDFLPLETRSSREAEALASALVRLHSQAADGRGI